jgi:hypothetical protein
MQALQQFTQTIGSSLDSCSSQLTFPIVKLGQFAAQLERSCDFYGKAPLLNYPLACPGRFLLFSSESLLGGFALLITGLSYLVNYAADQTALLAEHALRFELAGRLFGNGLLNGGRLIPESIAYFGSFPLILWDRFKAGTELLPYFPLGGIQTFK